MLITREMVQSSPELNIRGIDGLNSHARGMFKLN